MDESSLIAVDPRAMPCTIFRRARGIDVQVQPNGTQPSAFAVTLSDRGARSIIVEGRPRHLSSVQTAAVRAVLPSGMGVSTPCR